MSDLAAIAEACRPIAAADRRIVGLYVFGSRARREEHGGSDVDLAVLTPISEKLGLRELVDLETRFERTLGTRVDLVDVGHCDPFLALDVIRGERIYEADPVACDEFDLYVMRRAGDLAPFERERRRMLLETA